jgi:CRISPR/Cas system CSM-associated protein Csm3 (group 7 of RAMP superfamily)
MLWPISTTDVVRLTGISYRRIHDYFSRGLVAPLVPARGPGSRMSWSRSDIRLLIAIDVLASDLGVGGSGRRGGGVLKPGIGAWVEAVKAELLAEPEADEITVGRGRAVVVLQLKVGASL